MIKGLRLAFDEELGFFGRGRRVQELFCEAGIYMCEKSQMNTTNSNKNQNYQTKTKRKAQEQKN